MATSDSRKPADRRGSPRRVYLSNVALRLPDGKVLATRGLDISAGGVGLRCPVNLRIGTACHLQFSLTLRDRSVHTLVVPGTVVFSALSGAHDAFKVGVQFSELPQPSADILERFVQP
jgi:c-di-GMP-binding flagellar brake protein YcgR